MTLQADTWRHNCMLVLLREVNFGFKSENVVELQAFNTNITKVRFLLILLFLSVSSRILIIVIAFTTTSFRKRKFLATIPRKLVNQGAGLFGISFFCLHSFSHTETQDRDNYLCARRKNNRAQVKKRNLSGVFDWNLKI
jgi:hypothetical protein